MSESSLGHMRSLLADEFESRGWEYDLVTGKAIIAKVAETGMVDPPQLAEAVPSSFLRRNATTRGDIAEAIEKALGGRRPKVDASTTTLNINGNLYSLHVESGSQISGSQVNVGGTQINVQAGATRDEVLTGVAAIVRAGLDGDWKPDAARELAVAVDARADIGYEDVQAAVIRAGQGAGEPDVSRIKSMLQSVAVQGLSGALGTGMVAGFTALLHALGAA